MCLAQVTTTRRVSPSGPRVCTRLRARRHSEAARSGLDGRTRRDRLASPGTGIGLEPASVAGCRDNSLGGAGWSIRLQRWLPVAAELREGAGRPRVLEAIASPCLKMRQVDAFDFAFVR